MMMKHFGSAISFLLFLGLFIPAENAYAQFHCPDTAEALTPAPLETEWSVAWWMPRHHEKLQEEGRESAKLLFIGDSITHGWENTGRETWEKTFGAYGAYNIGYSGDRTENVLWRLHNGEVDGINPKLAIMMIGTNNTGHRQDSPDCTARGIELILDELSERLPTTRILLLAIFPRGDTPDHELRLLNNEINERIAKLADNDRVFFADINHAFLDDEGILSEEIMPDFLHPNEYGYTLWADELEPVLKQLLD